MYINFFFVIFLFKFISRVINLSGTILFAMTLRSIFIFFIMILRNVHYIVRNINYRTLATGFRNLCYEYGMYILCL